MIAVIDYGAGNLFSVKNALSFLGLDCVITGEKREIEDCGSVILPGVGAFPDAMGMLERAGLTDFLAKQARKKPVLGICLGAQLLFERGYEHTETKGLSLIPGSIVKIESPGLKIPHIGWNSLVKTQDAAVLEGVSGGACAYFVHSYRIETDEKYISAYCEYGERIPAAVQNGNVFGVQFHPEKSGGAGLSILRNFGRLT